MAVIATINGLVRGVETVRKRDDGTVMGSRLRVLSEPNGDPIDVMAWDRTFPVGDVQALAGATVEVLVDISAQAFRGSASLQADLREVKAADLLEAPAPK